MARGYFYQEKLTESTATNQTTTTVDTISFNPDANSTYWLFASGQFTCNTTTDNFNAHIHVVHSESPTIELVHQVYRAKEVTTPPDYVPWFGIARLDFGAAPGTHGVRVALHNDEDGPTSKCKNTRLVLLKAAVGDLYSESLSQTTMSTATYTIVTQLSISAGAVSNHTFLVVGTGELSSDVNSVGGYAQLNFLTDGYVKGNKNWRNLDDFDYTGVGWQSRLSVTAGTVHTVRLEYRTMTSGTAAYFKNGRILALIDSGFDSGDFQYTEGSLSGSTTSSSDFAILTTSDTIVTSGLPTLIIGTADVAPQSATVSNYWGIKKEATSVIEYVKEANTAGGYMSTMVAFIETLTAGEQSSWSWYTRSEASSIMNWDDVAISWMHLTAEAAAATTVAATGLAQSVGFGVVPVICPKGF